MVMVLAIALPYWRGGREEILFPAVLLDFNVLTVLLFYNYFTQNITIRVDVIWLISYGAIYFIPDILL
jgi:hypothetical protein